MGEKLMAMGLGRVGGTRAVCGIGRRAVLRKQLEMSWESREAVVVGDEGTGGGMEKSKERWKQIKWRTRELEDKGGDKKLFRLAKVRERKARDLDRVKCVKDEDGKVLVDEALIRRRWQSYFHKLLNEEGDRDIVLGNLEYSERRRDFGYCRSIKVEEVKGVVRRMHRGRATGPDEIPGEFWKSAGRAGLEWLTGLFNVIFKTAKMPEEWRWSMMVPLYKNKGDIQSCNNYRGIKLLSHTMKVVDEMEACFRSAV
ncbi:uncharacterized protein LOC132066460 [Lycium ferocissimum]|uniref:uncharacterized protein LOC132066460 n=1 Tax=Lycium ferocissimum TaxID=112874 RepID=UPI002815F6B6|nr:uncharacterized protein LOC132066460 [Lycium ferocissimum]